LREIIGERIEILEVGALDGKTMDDVKKIALNIEDYVSLVG